ncbi:PorT family protein [Hymenobacter lutimineralis]|uniref:PorT family protein n=1 Tax=Hymenobacter lutimineralis TaxID=2606448 RepID=A0A5D6V3E2_9BACT|nr:porin family protein [Hymenobacter lutimineralis]TYZ09552.1 PorT family protein [Hymenobacter lutimineralis]
MKKTIYCGLFVTGICLAAASSASAQVTIGARVGLNAATIGVNLEDEDDEEDFNPKMILGPQVGVTVNAQFGSFAIQPSLLFAQKGYRIQEDEEDGGIKVEYKSTTRLSYLELPVNFVYTLGEEDGFQLFAGPYVGFGISGKDKSEISLQYNGQKNSDSQETDIVFANEYGDDEDKDYLRGLDYGLNAGLGYKAGPIQAQLGYGLGLGNLITNSKSGEKPDDKIHNRVLHLSVAYFFGGK